MKDLLRRTATGISLVVLFVGSILLGPLPFLLMILLVFLLCIRELYTLYDLKGTLHGVLFAFSGGLLIILIYAGLRFHLSPAWMAIPALLWISGYLYSGSHMAGSLTLFWLVIPFASFYALGWVTEGGPYRPLLPVSVISLVWINDTFAYLTGSLLGRHRLTPRLSPGKTWEGTVGGMVFTLFAGWAVCRITGTYPLPFWLLVVTIICLLGLAGDLFESHLKRMKNVKDMGTLLPGHGGVLDRFDSLLFVAPAILIYVILLNLGQ